MNKKHINIPVFIPHLGCPNQCVFCNQKTISGVMEFDPSQVDRIITEALSTIDISSSDVEIAFFGGSFTGIDYSLMCELLSIAYSYVKKGSVSSIRLSTRPDYIDDRILNTLKKYGVKTVELGLQSVSEKVLQTCKRGHTALDAEKACRLIREYGFELVGQMMIGLPGSSLEDEMNTAEFILRNGASGVRIYPTVVLQQTELKDMCLSGIYTPLAVEDAIMRSKEVARFFIKNNIDIIRVGLCASENLHSEETYFAGPNHSALGELVYGEVYYDLILEELKFLTEDDVKGKRLNIEVPFGAKSKAIGQKRKNILRLQELYGFSLVNVEENECLSAYEIKIHF